MVTRSDMKWSLVSWASGCPMPDGLTTSVVLADASHLRTMREHGFISDTTIVFAPTPTEGVDVVYEGSFDLQSTEVFLAGDFGIQVMPFALADFIPAVGRRSAPHHERSRS